MSQREEEKEEEEEEEGLGLPARTPWPWPARPGTTVAAAFRWRVAKRRRGMAGLRPKQPDATCARGKGLRRSNPRWCSGGTAAAAAFRRWRREE